MVIFDILEMVEYDSELRFPKTYGKEEEEIDERNSPGLTIPE